LSLAEFAPSLQHFSERGISPLSGGWCTSEDKDRDACQEDNHRRDMRGDGGHGSPP
jgi:hypothetical protein